MASEEAVFGVPETANAAGTERLTDAIEAGGGRFRVGALDDLLATGAVSTSSENSTEASTQGSTRAPQDDDLADAPDAVLGVGHASVTDLAERGVGAPVLPVDAGPGVPSVPVEDLEEAIRAIVAGEARTEPTPLLDVAVDGERVATAYREATVLTAEPAHISEYAIGHEGIGPIDVVRADGVVVATPAGSQGYAAAGDGPLLSPGTGMAIVPVAPFRTDRDRWVVPLDRVTVRVQRDKAAVLVEGDGEVLATVGRDAEVSLTPADKLGVLVVDASVRGR